MTLHVFYTYTYTECGGINNVLIFFPPHSLGKHNEIPETCVFFFFFWQMRGKMFFIFFLFDFWFLIIYTSLTSLKHTSESLRLVFLFP